jgi:hypothetical protein
VHLAVKTSARVFRFKGLQATMNGKPKKKRRPFFIESKLEVFDWSDCDRCGQNIKQVEDGKCFWNPNDKARIKNICRVCYERWFEERNAIKRRD